MRKIFTFLIVLLCMVIPLSAADKALSLQGSGTEEDPWIITNAADLLQLADACNTPVSGTSYTTSNTSHYDGKFFKITSDIDLKDSGFYGIAVAKTGFASNANCYFGGNIDGDGHTISNMRIEGAKFDATTGKVLGATKDGSRKWVGFVGNLGRSAMTAKASVRNLKFDSSCYISSYGDCGSVVGKMFKLASVENVVSYCTVESFNSNSGGIAGSSASAKDTPSTIRNCSFHGIIREVGKVGGIIGDNGSNGIIADCLMTGTVQSGNWSDSQSTQSTSAGSTVGGIAGNNSGSITGCAATGIVKSGQWIEHTGTSVIKWGEKTTQRLDSNTPSGKDFLYRKNRKVKP